MRSAARPFGRRLVSAGLGLAFLGLLGLLVACGSESQAKPEAPPASLTVAPQSASSTAAPTPTPIPLNPLKVQPDTGYIGDSFTITGEGLPAGKAVELFWVTWDGDYVTEVSLSDVKFIERKFTEKRVSLGQGKTNAQGQLTATFVAPDDYGETHDIYAVIEGQDVARGGFRILRTVSFTPAEGPVGTPITITVKGLGPKTFESTMGLLYDHRYTGFITGVKTRGTAVFQIRAAGEAGPHLIEVIGAATALPYLNNWQSPTSYIPWEFRHTFTVTEGGQTPSDGIEWPDKGSVANLAQGAPRTGLSNSGSPGIRASLDPSVGPILTQSNLKASGLPANAEIELIWVTAAGSDVSGWDVFESPLGKATTAADGTLNTTIEIPEGLGGWHVVKIGRDGKTLAEAPFRVDRSFVEVSPKRVKAGETFKVQIKGLGWTQMDNGVAVTYDNSYIGFACGFGTGGDITLFLTATGDPGVHLIDLYPMIYQGARGLKGTAKPPWTYQVPFLTALRDFPASALGYNLPIFRLAIEIAE